jgi:hypothetical protein
MKSVRLEFRRRKERKRIDLKPEPGWAAFIGKALVTVIEKLPVKNVHWKIW